MAAEVRANDGTAVSIVADVTDPAQATRAINDAATALGSIDVCVDVVGGSRWSPVDVFSDEDWDWTIANNLSQVFYVYRAAARHMIDQGTGGALVSLSSVDGIQSAALHMPYGAAKAGLISLTSTHSHRHGQETWPMPCSSSVRIWLHAQPAKPSLWTAGRSSSLAGASPPSKSRRSTRRDGTSTSGGSNRGGVRLGLPALRSNPASTQPESVISGRTIDDVGD